MARTALLRSLREMARGVRLSQRTGVPMDELQAMRAARLLSRRQFLAGASIGAAALALPSRALASRGQSVIVVGGGIAGLTCALTLRERGHACQVYEASGRIGGRMFSNRRYWRDGQISEWGGELIDTDHATVRGLAERYDLPLDDLRAAEPIPSTDAYRLGASDYSFAQAVADFGEIASAVSIDASKAGFPTLHHTSTAHGAKLDRMSIYDWIESRVPGGHSSPLGKLLDIAYETEYGAHTKQQSSLNLVYLLGSQPSKNGFDIFGSSDERYHIRGGNQRLPEAMANDLGESVTTGHSLVRLAQTSGGRYVCTFERGGGTFESIADLVVLAIPFAVLADVDTKQAGFDALKTTAIQELGRAHNGKLQLQFTHRGWTDAGLRPVASNGSSYSDTGYQSSWEGTRAQPGNSGILVLYSGGAAADAMHTRSPFATARDARVRKDAKCGVDQLAPVYPGLTWNKRATQTLAHRSALFGASYSYWKVGQYTQFAGYEAVPQGGVYFCGEHTSTDFQGYMEGGAATGRDTALALAKILD